MKTSTIVRVAAAASISAAPVHAQDLVGPTDAWYGIDNLEVTYSGGTALFNVRFDRRSFNDVFGEGMPDLPLSSVEDIGAAYTEIAAFFNSIPIRQTQLRPIIPVAGTPDVVDNLFLPISYTDETINGVVNVDDGGPTGWRFNPEFDLFTTFTIDRDQAFVGPDKETDAVWAVFTLVEEPCLPDVNGDGSVTPTDFTAWINAFNNDLPECDQNGDNACTPTDFTAWIANFNAGCP
ncbi:MAG: hypothetical protein ED559_13765 [Phycisphaera sp.]|nr:MAG: hypothetical protein ED559_13765 [Phycisphaera sp.]